MAVLNRLGLDAGAWVRAEHDGDTKRCAELDAQHADDPQWLARRDSAAKDLEFARPPKPTKLPGLESVVARLIAIREDLRRVRLTA